MSQCKTKGMHYFKVDKRNGFACLLCGFTGDLDTMRAVKCLPQTVPADGRGGKCMGEDAKLAALQEAEDERLAQELAFLEKQEAAMRDMVLLEQLQAEEAVLESLLLERAAAEKANKAEPMPATPDAAPF